MNLLKLAALDAEDLDVLSAHVQDALVLSGDIRFLPAEKRLVLALKRYVWDGGERAENERRASFLTFDRVMGVKVRGIDPSRKDTVLSLLAIRFVPGDSPAGEVELVFSGKGELRLAVECIEAALTDTPAAWSVKSRPSHGEAEEG